MFYSIPLKVKIKLKTNTTESLCLVRVFRFQSECSHLICLPWQPSVTDLSGNQLFCALQSEKRPYQVKYMHFISLKSTFELWPYHQVRSIKIPIWQSQQAKTIGESVQSHRTFLGTETPFTHVYEIKGQSTWHFSADVND